MKNKLFTFSVLLFSGFLLASCSTSRGYSSHKKGYGCPNSSGIIIAQKNKALNA